MFITSTPGLRRVSRTAITAVSALDILGFDPGKDYIVKLDGFCPTDDAENLYMRLSDDGSTFEAGVADYGWAGISHESGFRDNSDSEIDLMGFGFGNDAGHQNLFEIMFSNPRGTDYKSMMLWDGFTMDSTPNDSRTSGSSLFLQGNDAVHGCRFLWSGGSTFKAQGYITVYERDI